MASMTSAVSLLLCTMSKGLWMSRTRVLEFIFVASFTITTLLLIIPFEYRDGNPVPTAFFKGLPTAFQDFVVCLVFSFSGSLSALLIRDTSLLAKFCEYSSNNKDGAKQETVN
ncbi:hypothetical protein LOK49_LG06G01058 [Camellia lanceoleosa]|uniref:Uncharacterized protein n=1 Tax=Camellia lanceoleosa TaxID=1840588 RepID=A0ACC0H9F0_9ERIC|nr:hypothetical protein LOK49_LG06G01058 [Camellia lanceoleosa]